MLAQLQSLTSLDSVDAAAWNALAGDSPFLRYEFLHALEQSGCVGAGTTWQPCYIVAHDARGGGEKASPARSSIGSGGRITSANLSQPRVEARHEVG